MMKISNRKEKFNYVENNVLSDEFVKLEFDKIKKEIISDGFVVKSETYRKLKGKLY